MGGAPQTRRRLSHMKTNLSRIPFVSFAPENLLCYGYDASKRRNRPDAVAFPTCTDDVVSVVKAATADGYAIIPRGAGTGMVAGAIPAGKFAGAIPAGKFAGAIPEDDRSLVISLERMNRILEIDEDNMVAVVEPGVINGRLQRALKDIGLFYPPDPGSLNFCTLGGNVATCAGGPRAVKYGVTRDYVMGLEIVLADGTVMNTGGRAAKRVVGYDLTRLIAGSEGTLGIVTKITLKLLRQPESVATLMAVYREMAQAAESVAAIMKAGITPRALEIMDRHSLRAVEAYKPLGLPTDGAMLLVEIDGGGSAVNDDMDRIAALCGGMGGELQIARSESSAESLWEARRAISPALYRLKPTKINEDIAVPRGKVPEMFRRLDDISERFAVLIVSFGHAGDGNIHVNVMTDKNDTGEYSRAKAAVEEVFRAALDLGGTISGEHGIGLAKKPYIGMELNPETIALMKRIKAAFDPGGMMNPGKIFP